MRAAGGAMTNGERDNETDGGTTALWPPSGKERVAVLGCGTLGAVIVRGLQHAQGRRAYELLVTQRTRERALEVTRRLGVVCETDNPGACERATIVLLAVRPESMLDLLQTISTSVRPGTLCISVAAGISLRVYEERLPPDVSVVRALPTPMMTVRRGLVAMSASVRAEAVHVEKARRLFGLLCEEALLVPEQDLNLFAALHGSSAALLYRFIDALLRAAGEDPRRGFSSRSVMAAMLEGVARTLVKSDESPRALAREICTPAGITAAGEAVWEDHRVDEVLEEALYVVLRRAEELGRGTQ